MRSTTYGAIPQQDPDITTTNTPAVADRSFDGNNVYYLKEPDLPLHRRVRKAFLVALPLIISAVIMGGFAFYLYRHFNKFYPPHTGVKQIRSSSPTTDVVTPTTTTTTTTSATNTELADTQSSDGYLHAVSTKNMEPSPDAAISGTAACTAHAKCAGLVGNCCPTPTGKMLDCCK